MKVAFTQEAETDLLNIFEYLLPRNPGAAARIVDQLEERCRSLAGHPHRGTVVLVRHGRELRRVLEPPFVIVYEIRSDLISIARVFHGARDGRALLDGITLSESDT